MSDLILNWRFGAWHFQIKKNAPHVRISKNPHWVANKPPCWFERY